VLLLLAQVCLLEFRLFRLELFAQGLFTSVIIELYAALIKCLCGLSDAQWA